MKRLFILLTPSSLIKWFFVFLMRFTVEFVIGWLEFSLLIVKLTL